MNIQFFLHVPFETPGYIETWVAKHNYNFKKTNFFEKYKLPDISEFDWLIIMGGPMGVYEEGKFSWLKEEKEFIKKSIGSGKIVLGICLGSQLIASSLSADVYPNKCKEIGWLDIHPTAQGKQNFLFSDLPDQLRTLQWHGDTFDLPNGAIHLAESEACANQAFVYNEKVLALQFHLEVTGNSLHAMVRKGKIELIKDKYVQTGEEILQQRELISMNNKFMSVILDKLASRFPN